MVGRLLALIILWAALPPASAQVLRLTLEVVEAPAAPVVGEMLRVRLHGVYPGTTLDESLDMPRSAEYDWVRLLEDRWQVNTQGELEFERDLAVFPKRSGRLQIGPFVHELLRPAGGGERRSIAVRAEPVQIEVQPFPAANEWPLAARAMELSDEWSRPPGELPDGETVTRRVTLTALGVLPENLPPQPVMGAPWLISLSPPEQRELQITPLGPVTRITWAWQLRPRTGQPGVLPEVRIDWFDTGQRQLRQLVLAAAPIGYAGFARDRDALVEAGLRGGGWLLAALLAGLVPGLALLLPRLQVGAGRLRALRDALHGWRLRWALQLAARRGDAAAAWRTAQAIRRWQGWRWNPAQAGAVRALEAHLFGAGDSRSSFGFDAFLRAFNARAYLRAPDRNP